MILQSKSQLFQWLLYIRSSCHQSQLPHKLMSTSRSKNTRHPLGTELKKPAEISMQLHLMTRDWKKSVTRRFEVSELKKTNKKTLTKGLVSDRSVYYHAELNGGFCGVLGPASGPTLGHWRDASRRETRQRVQTAAMHADDDCWTRNGLSLPPLHSLSPTPPRTAQPPSHRTPHDATWFRFFFF